MRRFLRRHGGPLAVFAALAVLVTATAAAAPLRATRVVASDDHTCALAADGRVFCWGDNQVRSLGRDTQGRPVGAPVLLPDVDGAIDVAVTSGISCALDQGGRRVSCFSQWLEGGRRTVTLGAPAERATVSFMRACVFGGTADARCFELKSPVPATPPGLAGARVLDLRLDHSMNGTLDCALLARDGGREVVCRGRSKPVFGDEAARERFVPVPALRGARAIATPGGQSVCAVDADARVRCLHHGWLKTPPPGTAAEVETGGSHACVRAPEGAITCWNGLDSPGVADATALAVGASHACTLRRDGQVACWGDDEQGQLGAGIVLVQPRPVRVAGVHDARRLILGRRVSCAQRADGTVLCWGGWGARSAAAIEVPALAGAKSLALSQIILVGLRPDGGLRAVALATLSGEPRVESNRLPPLAGAASVSVDRVPNMCAIHGGRVSCLFDMGYQGGAFRDGWVSIDGPRDAVELATTATGLCVRERRGTVACLRDDRWDNDERWPTKRPPLRTHPVAGLGDVVALDAGQSVVYARRRDGAVFAIDERHRTRAMPALAGAEALDSNHAHVCILRRGVVSCQGGNGWGQLGRGHVSSSIEQLPLGEVALPGRATQLGVGFEHSCAIDQAGDVWCWGSNVGGEVDAVRAGRRTAPVTVRLE